MKEKNIRKQRIINAMIELLKEKPIEEVTMRSIAAKAGLTTGALYHHFKNKDELCFSVMQESLHFSNNLYKTVKNESSNMDGKELLNEINNNVKIRLNKIEQQTLHVQFFSDMIKRKADINDKYHDSYKDILNSVGELLIKAFELEDDPRKKYMANILVAAIDGMAMQQAINVLPEDLEKTIEVFIDFFNVGIPAYLNKN